MDGQVDEEKMEKIAKKKEDQEENGYIRYNYKLKDYDCEFYHFEFMKVVQKIQRYLNEPTCQDLIKAFR
jgi:hypothetical protein